MGFFGLVGTTQMPIQLLPDISSNQIVIESQWQENTAEDVEEIISIPLEEALSGLAGVKEMSTSVSSGRSVTTLDFEGQTDNLAALIATTARLNLTRSLPADATFPVIAQDGVSSSDTVATLLLYANDKQPSDHHTRQNAVRDIVIPALIKVEGVSEVDVSYSERQNVIWINTDPIKLAIHRITLEELKNKIASQVDYGAGTIDEYRERLSVRFNGKPELAKLENIIVSWSDGIPIHLSEIARIDIGYAPQKNVLYKNGKEAYYIDVRRGSGANSFEIITRLKQVIHELNGSELKVRGLELGISLDTTINIQQAISNVTINLFLGIFLVYLVLYIFVRNHRAAIAITLSVPISLTLSFTLLYFLGGSINVVSLAGFAFSVGLIIDAAIVVQDAIISSQSSHSQLKENTVLAAQKISKALLASSLTTIIIFIPISLIESEIGQLLSDLALAMSISIIFSTFSALTIVPLTYYFLCRQAIPHTPPLEGFWRFLAIRITSATQTPSRKVFVIIGCIIIPAFGFFPLLPAKHLLPEAGDNLLRAYITLPSHTNLKTLKDEYAGPIVNRMNELLETDLPIRIRTYNLVMSSGFSFLIAYPEKPEQLSALIEHINNELFVDEENMTVFAEQEPMIYFRSPASKNVHLNIHGTDLSELVETAKSVKQQIQSRDLAASVNIRPGETFSATQLLFKPLESELSAYNLKAKHLGEYVQLFGAGLFTGKFNTGREQYDMYLLNAPSGGEMPEQPVVLDDYSTLPLSMLTTIERMQVPDAILRVNGQRTIRLEIIPFSGQSLERLTEQLNRLMQDDFILPLETINASYTLKGIADIYNKTIQRVAIIIISALVILFVLVVILFKSLRTGLMVFSTMPIALFGGSLFLYLTSQVFSVTLDVLTMFGFVIAMGLIVNNAILILSELQSLHREGLSGEFLIQEALFRRSRPIFITSLTSIFGMLPLALSPGVGAEMYSGMSIVIVGAMTFSLLFGMVIVASLQRHSV
jgi:multidrug efflux pump subunit AcrB